MKVLSVKMAEEGMVVVVVVVMVREEDCKTEEEDTDLLTVIGGETFYCVLTAYKLCTHYAVGTADSGCALVNTELQFLKGR